MSLIKKLLKHILKKFNIGIYRIAKETKQQEPDDPIDLNSQEVVNECYSIEENIVNYLSEDRISFYNQLIDLAVKEGIILENKNVLDVGCGPGALLNELNKKFENAKLTGIDFSEKAIIYAQKNTPSVTFKAKDIFKHHIEEKYDIIFCTEVLEHLTHPSLALKKISESISSGGTLILTVPNGRIDTHIGHINFWSPESWTVFLKDHYPDCKINTFLINNNTDSVAFITKNHE